MEEQNQIMEETFKDLRVTGTLFLRFRAVQKANSLPRTNVERMFPAVKKPTENLVTMYRL